MTAIIDKPLGVLLNLVKNIFQPYSGFFKHVLRVSRILITPLADHPQDTAVNDKHGAGPAGGHPAVEGRPFNRNTPPGGLADGVLFRVNRPDAMGGYTPILMNHLFELVPRFVAVG
jgi:hypothetical protein